MGNDKNVGMQPDHETVRAGLPEGFCMTEFRKLALSTCDRRLANLKARSEGLRKTQ